MTVSERDIVNHYNIATPFPDEWPAELDDNDDDSNAIDEVASPREDISTQKHRSRYWALQPQTSGFPGQKSNKRDNLVLKDESDPLGTSNSVVEALKLQGLPVEDNIALRNRFLLSSTSFSPALFLSQAHSSDSTQSLLRGLEFLSKTIDKKSASLKVLVESNFERFVRAKATIDNVYKEMRTQGTPQSLSATSPAAKNSVTKESEYGVKGIRIPLTEAIGKVEEVWGPAIGGRQREDGLKAAINTMERHQVIYEVGGNIRRSIKQRDYEIIVAQYNKARRYANDAKLLAEWAASNDRQLDDDEVCLIIITGKMWMEVEKQIQEFKRDLWRRLSNIQAINSIGRVEEHMELINALLELGVEANPIWVWLLGHYEHLKNRVMIWCDRSRAEIEVFRRRLSADREPAPTTIANYLRMSAHDRDVGPGDEIDRPKVNEMWEHIHTFLRKLLSSESGLLGDVLEFWDSVQSFVDGDKQKILPAGFEGESRKHHRLSASRVSDLYSGVVELVNLIHESIWSFFVDPPVEDVSVLLSSANTGFKAPTSTLSPIVKFNPQDIPSLPPRKGDPWEDFAFWPPHSNSPSGVYYLSKFLILLGTACSDMGTIKPIVDGNPTYEKLKTLVSATRERFTRILCSIWGKDAEYCKFLEDWTRDHDRKNVTNMPRVFVTYENSLLTGIQKIMYISEVAIKSGTTDVVTPPPTKLLQLVRSQFVSSIYKALSGLVENSQNPILPEGDNEWIHTGLSKIEGSDGPSSIMTAGDIDSKNRNVRILLTLSNLRVLMADHVPQLINTFEAAFSVKLTDETKTILDVLRQIDARLFQTYIRPITTELNSTINSGISSNDWVPSSSRPVDVKPYVYSVMLQLVMVHTEVTTTLPLPFDRAFDNNSVTYAVLSYLLTQISSSLLTAFTMRPRYILPALMQATLDTEFIAQTLSPYATDEASKLQSQIYLELDRRTTNESRTRLQTELGEMRLVLRRLRENTCGEFACFKKPKAVP